MFIFLAHYTPFKWLEKSLVGIFSPKYICIPGHKSFLFRMPQTERRISVVPSILISRGGAGFGFLFVCVLHWPCEGYSGVRFTSNSNIFGSYSKRNKTMNMAQADL